MQENRLIHKIGGNPYSIRDVNHGLDEMVADEKAGKKLAPAKRTKAHETAIEAMSHAVPKKYTDMPIAHVKNGRPTDYRKEMGLIMYEMLIDPKRCWTLKSISAVMGVYETTMHRWIQANEDLQYYIHAGRAIQETNFGSMLLHGFKYSSGVEYILTNLHDWTSKQKTEHAIDLNSAIADQEKLRREQDEEMRDTEARRVDWKSNDIVDSIIDV